VAFSGDKTWGLTRDDIIAAALRKIGEYDSADGPSPAEKTDASLALNAITKEWSAEGLGIWVRQRTILFLSKGQPYYWLGPNPNNDTTNLIWHQATADNHFKVAALNTAGVATDTVLNITDTDWRDINNQSATKPTATGPPQIGVRLDDGSIHWTTIASVASGTVTLTTGIPSAAAAGRRVYAFLTRTSRPVRCLHAYRTDTSWIDAPMQLIGRVNYEQQSNKLSSGDPTQVVFEGMVAERTSSALHARVMVWPAQNSMTCDYINLITEHYVDDFDAASNNPQFPAEWANALIWNLAAELAFEYGLPVKDRQQLLMVAGSKKANLVNSSDLENASVSLEPDYGR
jgi:hypothetical protein